MNAFSASANYFFGRSLLCVHQLVKKDETLMKTFLTACLTTLICALAHAQQFAPKDLKQQVLETPLNAYRFIGNTIICKSDKPDINPNPCNRIGDISVGDSWSVVDQKLGKPSRVIPRTGGVLAFVYLVKAADGNQAYWVVERAETQHNVRAIQITGKSPVPNASFSSIQLTDTEEKVRQILGPRYIIREVPEINGVMWDYTPFKITIEFVGGTVYSIRVADDS